MTRSPENQPDGFENLEALIEAWQSGDITPDEWDALCALLRANSDVRDRFLLRMQVEAGLHWKFSERGRASAVLAEDFPQTASPLSLSNLAEGSYSRDDAYCQIVEVVANEEANDLLWAQAYPRLRSYVALCLSRPLDVESAVSSIANYITDRYHDGLSSADFGELIRRSARKITQERLTTLGGAALLLEEWMAPACLGQPDDRDAVNVSALYERLESYVPYQLSEGRLQLLCLRYLHEFTPEQIGVRLSTTKEQVQLELAKARILIWKQCCEPPFNKTSQAEIDHLLIVNMLVDRRTLTSDSLERLRKWLNTSERHRHMLGSFAILHECIGRQLTVQRLLESLTESTSKTFQNSVGLAIRQIELFACKTATPASPTVTRDTRKWRVPATALTAAALLLVVLGLIFRQSRQHLEQPQFAEKKPTTQVLPPAAREPLPTVATVTELVDIGSESVPRVGAKIRQGDSLLLPEGIVELTTISGSIIVLEGPTEIVFRSEYEISLKQGKLAGLNSTKEQTLMVHTPTAIVEDLGTEFGVGVRKDGSTSVAVYQGSVEVSGAVPDAEKHTLKVGWRTSIDQHGALDEQPATLVHDREFVRPDEVQLRVAAKQGSQSARSQIAFYELLRIEGVLAYNGFGSEPEAKHQTFGFDAQGIRSSQGISLGDNLSIDSRLSIGSRSIVAADERRYFLDLDKAAHSALVRAGLLTPGGFVGEQSGEVWVSWRSQLKGIQNDLPDWAGVSFMCGDERQKDEPLFVGVPVGASSYGVGIFDGRDRSKEHHHELDLNATTEGVQSMPVGEQQNLWIVHLSMKPDSADVSVWCNVPIEQVVTTSPNVRQSIEHFRFDRFRFELASPGQTSTCAFDDLLVATNREALEAALNIIGAPSADRAP